MHAPLYYRLSGLVAYVFARIGMPDITAAFVAGRGISFASFLLTLVVMYRLSQIDGPNHLSGLLTVGLIIAAPIPGMLAVMVRPDMTAVAFQTLGVGLVVAEIKREKYRLGTLLFAYGCFALAVCSKQQTLAGAAVSTAFLLGSRPISRRHISKVILAIIAFLTLVLVYCALENWMTDSRMIHVVISLPSGPFRRWNYGSPSKLWEVISISSRKLAGFAALGLACAISPGSVRRLKFVDAFMAAFLVVECVEIVPLCMYNSGAADNYILQASVLACLLLGRSLGSFLRSASVRPRYLALIALASFAILLRDAQFLELAMRTHHSDQKDLRQLLTDIRISAWPKDTRIFIEEPGLTRMYGRMDLVYDEWLYGAFESAGEAEPRERWLKRIISHGSVQLIITASDRETVPGILLPLKDLGYLAILMKGRFQAWVRPSPPE
jgi:hypothetical protein